MYYTNDGKNTSTFLPEFPASCLYVTAVGGTYHECPDFSRPAYQALAVDSYLAQNPSYLRLYDGLFNPYGRAFPDVVAQSNNFTLYRLRGLSAW